MAGETMLGVATYATEDEARAVGQRLVSSGVGATLAESDNGWEVQVLETEVPRACELLELDHPRSYEPPGPRRPPWKMLLGIWVVAMVTLPLLAFWLTITLAE